MSDPVFAQRYARAAAHDRRFDGYFVTGIPMSEIFCRPGCATRTPRPTQVVFYPTAAAAHAAGLLPCPRCRPDMTCAPPGSAHADTLAASALRLIADGELDRTGVEGVARRVGVTSRQVLRAVESEAGCGPLAVARAARAHLARLLLTATTIPIAEVATAAGSTSVRQFNTTILQFYGMTPGAIRGGAGRRGAPGTVGVGADRRLAGPNAPVTRAADARALDGRASDKDAQVARTPNARAVVARAADARALVARTSLARASVASSRVPQAAGPLVLRCNLPVRRPFDAAGIFGFLATNAIADVEEGGELWYARTVRLPHGAGHLRVDSRGPGGRVAAGSSRGALLVQLTVQDPRDIATMYSRVRRLLDADADPIPIDARLAQDPALAPSVAAHPGVRVPGTVDIEETLFRVLIGQRATAFAVRALLNRLARLLGEATPWGLLFPTVDAIAAHARAVLTGPAERIRTIVDIAQAIVAARPHLHYGCSRAELASALNAFPGIDAATIDRVVRRVLGATDVLLTDVLFAGDARLRRGAEQLRMPTNPTTLAHHAMLWSPWQSYGAMHLWHAANAEH